MATEIAKAYVQILPTTKGIKNELTSQLGGEVEGAGKSAGSSFGSSLVKSLTGIVAAAGIGTIIKQSLDAGGAVQQSFGGLDTLYGSASQAAKDYARDAAAAGISMNDYAEQAVSFGASLKQAFQGAGNAEELAAKAANTAILDMADNAAKMGTPLESIQNAYQGFAKQNYTMLDNLKLGYGGTKTEMERLLKDASQLEGAMGKTFDINNLGDVYEAIHLIQEDLGLTGVAAAEAEGTFTGSMASMKAAANNLLADLALGNSDAIAGDMMIVLDSAFNFVQNNLAPMVANFFEGVPGLLTQGLSGVIRSLNIVSYNAGAIVSEGASFVKNLVIGIGQQIPYIIEAGIRLIKSFAEAIMNTDWGGMAQECISELSEYMEVAAIEIFGSDSSLLDALLSWVANTLPGILQQGFEIVSNLANGILQNLPTLIASGAEIIAKLLAKIGEYLPTILQTGIELIGELVVGIIRAIPKVVAAIPKIISGIKERFEQYNWKDIGSNIIDGIKNGIANAAHKIWDAVKDIASNALQAAKEALGIASPSKKMRDEVGRWIPEGIALGIEQNKSVVTDAMNDLSDLAAFGSDLSLGYSISGTGENLQGGYGNYNQTVNIYSPEALSPYEVARQTRNANRQMVLALRGV